MKGKNSAKALNAVNACLLALLGYFAWTTVYSSDDYWYSTFWDGGLRQYWDLMVLHYETFNGRVLVHVLAHIILHFEGWAFMLVCFGLVLLSVWVLSKGSGFGADRFRIMLLLFLTGLFCMPGTMFHQALMWISASCNYLFPSVLVCLLTVALERRSGWAYLLAFLCGATTEQMGLASTALCAAFAARAMLQKKNARQGIVCAVLDLVGVMTIFLSPATQNRAERKVPLDSLEALLEILRKSILREVGLLTENPAPLVVMLLVLGLGALVLWRRAGLKWPAVPAAVGCAALIVGSLGSENIALTGYCIGFGALAVIGVGLMLRGEGICGGLILAALAAAAVMLPTDTIAPRVMLPVYLLLLLADCVLLTVQIPRTERMAVPAAAALALVLVMMAPAVKGYWYNRQVDRINAALVEEDRDGPYIRYCIDYDMDYTWYKAGDDGYFQNKYVESVGLPESTPVRFFSENARMAPVFSGGTELVRLSLEAEDGKAMFPLRPIVEIMGGKLDWYGSSMVVYLDGTEYRIRLPADAMVVTWTDAAGVQRELRTARCLHCGATYCGGSLLTDAFGFCLTWDENAECWYITK